MPEAAETNCKPAHCWDVPGGIAAFRENKGDPSQNRDQATKDRVWWQETQLQSIALWRLTLVNINQLLLWCESKQDTFTLTLFNV